MPSLRVRAPVRVLVFTTAVPTPANVRRAPPAYWPRTSAPWPQLSAPAPPLAHYGHHARVRCSRPRACSSGAPRGLARPVRSARTPLRPWTRRGHRPLLPSPGAVHRWPAPYLALPRAPWNAPVAGAAASTDHRHHSPTAPPFTDALRCRLPLAPPTVADATMAAPAGAPFQPRPCPLSPQGPMTRGPHPQNFFLKRIKKNIIIIIIN